MQYKELNELTLKDWNGQPLNAVVNDNKFESVCLSDNDVLKAGEGGNRIVGFMNGQWIDEDGETWRHAYPLSMNKHLLEPSKPRMTHRQLAMWLAKGNGEYSSDTLANVYTQLPYSKDVEHDLVGASLRVRKWDSEEWIEPTTDLLEE